MIIGVSGKIGAGKDTVGKIIQCLVNKYRDSDIIGYITDPEWYCDKNITIEKFANKLKDIVCLLTGCNREQLESEEFKNSEMSKEWTRIIAGDYGYPHYELLTNIELLQFIDIDMFRNTLHTDTWINSLFNDYKLIYKEVHVPKGTIYGGKPDKIYPNWIITDVRFLNEVKAIRDKKSFIIRVNRDSTKLYTYSNDEVYEKLIKMGFKFENFEDGEWCEEAINMGFKFSESLDKWSFDEDNYSEPKSETELDNYSKFDYIIDNNDTIDNLIEVVRGILIKEELI